jgi:multidrug efflux pump subunit AcrA (membrane-fusion protein)
MNARLNVKLGAIAVVLAGSTILGCTSTPRASEPEGAPIAVSLGRAELADVATRFEAGGVVRSRTTALVASRVLAPIVEVHVRAGDRVRRGATLITLDAREIRANRTRAAAASLSAAESARAADADVRAADAALVLARATHERIAALHAKRSATAQELEQAVAALTAADAQTAAARARVTAANAARDSAQAAADSAEVSTSYAVLSAPFDGVVAERHADAGSMAMPGAPLLTLEDASALRLETTVDEARAARVAAGQAVDVRLDNAADGASDWVGARVGEVARVDSASHNFLIKIDLPQTAAWRSGLFGRAQFAGPSRRVLAAPIAALVKRGQLTFVYLVDAEARARLRPISAGTADSDRVEVLAGLHDGDVVVTSPPASLLDGARVTGGRR